MKLNPIHQKLIDKYWAAYHSHDPERAWVTNVELSVIQLRYSSRIHELRKAGIKVQTESDGGNGFRYRLLTNPDNINWDDLTARLSAEPIRKAPRRVAPNNQPSLFGGGANGLDKGMEVI